MNKATFSRLIKDSTYLSDADVGALEQVVQAFPYCQTAHMLLAKAASDKGSMLAPQRLRKAAIHAPSRALLKKLVEGKLNQPDPAQLASNNFSKSIQPAYNEEIEDLLENDLPEQNQPAEEARSVAKPAELQLENKPIEEAKAFAQEAQPIAAEEPDAQEIVTGTAPEPTEATPEIPAEAEPVSAEPAIIPTLAETEEEAVIAAELPEELAELTEPVSEETLAIAAPTATSTIVSEEITEPAEGEKQEGLSAFLAGLQQQPHLAETEAPELQPDLSELAEKQVAAQQPAQEAKPNQTGDPTRVEPEQAETAETKPEEQPAVTAELSEGILAEEETETEAGIGTETPEPLASEITVTPIPEILAETETEEKQLAKELTPLKEAECAHALPVVPEEAIYSESLISAIYRGNELGYAMSSSRMGESLQPKSELTREVPFHFQPELLVEYRHTQTEAEPAAPAEPKPIPQQDLINDFLKQASKTRPRASLLPKAEEQEDLSQKSTRLSKSMVSENLAQIFAMQGKTKKAIKIYQQLQLKMPEKKDYFAVLINKLQKQSS